MLWNSANTLLNWYLECKPTLFWCTVVRQREDMTLTLIPDGRTFFYRIALTSWTLCPFLSHHKQDNHLGLDSMLMHSPLFDFLIGFHLIIITWIRTRAERVEKQKEVILHFSGKRPALEHPPSHQPVLNFFPLNTMSICWCACLY